MKKAITKKAQILISTFTERELALFNYVIDELYRNTIETIVNSNREISVYNNKNPKYSQAIKEAHKEEFRLKYIIQCLDIYISYDYDTSTMNIKTQKDK